jgi:alpha-galactosidase
MYGVDMTKPGAQEYYDSVFALMASWGLDYVKVDDLSSPYHKDEIEAIRKAIDLGPADCFSTSPGATPVIRANTSRRTRTCGGSAMIFGTTGARSMSSSRG